LELIPEVYEIADTFYLYDNSDQLSRIAMKKRNALEIYPNSFWSKEQIEDLLGGKGSISRSEII